MSEKFPTMVVGVVVAILLITSLAIPVIADANTNSSVLGPNPDGHGITLALQKNNFAVDVDFTDNGDDTFTINGDTYDMQPQILMAWNDGVVYIDDDYRTVILTKNGSDQSSKIVTEFTANLTTTLDFSDDNNWSASFQMPSYIYTPDANGEYSSWVDTTDLKKYSNDTVIAVGSYAGADCYYNSQNTGVIQNLPLGLVAETDYTANEINSVIFVSLTDEETVPVDPATITIQPLDPSIIDIPFQPNDPVIIMTVPTPTYTDGDWGYDLITSGYDTTVAKIVSYSGAGGGAITIPAKVGGYDVKEIGKGGSSETVFDTSLVATNLTIPNGVVKINANAFYNCSGFTGSLVIPDSVTSIGNGAVSGCSGFTGSLVIPDSVISIGNNAFIRCSGFTGSLVIPDSVTSIGSYAFRSCSGFTSLIISMEQGGTIDSTSFMSTTNLKEVLNIGSLELTTTSYGLNADSVQDYIDACCYLAPVEIAGSDSDSLSVILNVIPILMILGVIMFVAGFVLYRRL